MQAFSVVPFLHLQQVISAGRVNCNYLYQFTWNLNSTEIILARPVMAWSTQWDGKAGIHESKNNLRGGV
jgi:hypothetical protein